MGEELIDGLLILDCDYLIFFGTRLAMIME